jgi:serine protease AprX
MPDRAEPTNARASGVARGGPGGAGRVAAIDPRGGRAGIIVTTIPPHIPHRRPSMSSPVRALVPVALLALALQAPAARADATAPDRLDPWVSAHLSATAPGRFLVVMRERADLRPAAALPERAARGRFVRDALLRTAHDSQAPLLAVLRARGVTYRSFHIVNAVLVEGPLSLARELAERDDVARVEGDPELPAVRPVTLTPAEQETAARAALAPQAIEPGVTAIRAPEVWALGATGQGIVIGSGDTGVQWDHPALKGHYRGWNGVTASHDYNWHDSIHSGGGGCGPNTTAPCDDYGHGTHTVGTAVGADSTGTNQVGVAPGARFIACRNMNAGVGTPATYLECMEWFLAPYPIGGTPAQGDPAMAPDVTINSWGCPTDEGCVPATLLEAVEAQRAAGILFVAAAGNSGSGCGSVSEPPGIYDAAYSVGAYASGTGTIASFSSRGPVTVDGSNRPKPDITAPGVSVRSSTRGGGYGPMSGTSMATPHVAGAVALLWSRYPELRHLIRQTEDILDQAAVDVSSTLCSSNGVPNNVYGWGRLDIKAAVDLGPLAVDPVTPALDGRLALSPAMPNPARRSTVMRVRLASAATVDLAVISVDGRRVRTLLRGPLPAGDHVVSWDGLDARGQAVPAGVYHVRAHTADAAAARKVIWLGR